MAGRSSGQGRGHQHLQGLSQHFLCGAAPLCAAAEVPPHIRRSEKKEGTEVSNLPLPTLKQLKKELEIIVQEASGELVGLLQKRQGLQEEVDIRSITIEQLLKFAERRQLQLGEPLAIQMSVVRNHCQEASSENGLG
ncbi:putative EURL protein domain-containing protein [Homarus americanus]|uniref:Putative EURL protein domain-containing protein n=1 Tax=Homarus americanus TaxID=6706 RepID=A0A8J5MXN7_HOMAM|nr:putative EURL protein domain-containing protein [Homarus americanus]